MPATLATAGTATDAGVYPRRGRRTGKREIERERDRERRDRERERGERERANNFTPYFVVAVWLVWMSRASMEPRATLFAGTILDPGASSAGASLG